MQTTKGKSLVTMRNRYKYELKKADMETPIGKSMAVPDDSYTIKEILERHANGMIPAIGKDGMYDEDPDHDDIDLGELNRSDLAEKHEILEQTRSTHFKISEAKKKADEKDAMAKEAAKKAAIEKAAIDKYEADLKKQKGTE